jgi:hypothetical protein
MILELFDLSQWAKPKRVESSCLYLLLKKAFLGSYKKIEMEAYLIKDLPLLKIKSTEPWIKQLLK